jgi:hypothetical protein
MGYVNAEEHRDRVQFFPKTSGPVELVRHKVFVARVSQRPKNNDHKGGSHDIPTQSFPHRPKQFNH